MTPIQYETLDGRLYILTTDGQRLPATATERALIVRIEQAEAEVLEQARLNGMGSEREARLLARVHEAEAEVTRLRGALARYGWHEPSCDCLNDLAVCSCGYDTFAAKEERQCAVSLESISAPNDPLMEAAVLRAALTAKEA